MSYENFQERWPLLSVSCRKRFKAVARRLPIFCLALSLLTTVGCGRKEDGANVLVMRLRGDVSTLDPAYIVDVSGGTVAAKLFSGLVRFDEKNRLQPDLAEKWELSPDNLTYLFHLRKNARFSDGTPCTAEDAAYSLKRILDPRTLSPRRTLFGMIAGAKDYDPASGSSGVGVEAVDRHTLRIRLTRPHSAFLSLLATPTGYVISRKNVEQSGGRLKKRIVCTGPFVLSEWRRNEAIRMTANPYYFEGKPPLEGVTYRIIPQDFTAVVEFENGGIDVLEIPSAFFVRFKSDPEWKPFILSQTGLNTHYLGFNCSRRPFDNPLVRRAFNHAINKQRVIRTVLEGQAVPAAGPVPPIGGEGSDFGFASSDFGIRILDSILLSCRKILDRIDKILQSATALSPYDYSPQKAVALLRQAKFNFNREISFFVRAEKEAENIAAAIEHDLSQIGIKVSLKKRLWTAYKQAINKGEPDIFYLSWSADYPDAQNFLRPCFYSSHSPSEGNRVRFKNKKVDQLLDALEAASSERGRNQLCTRIEKLIVEEAPWVFLWHRREYVVRQPWVEGWKMYPIYNANKLTDVTIRRGEKR
ncbi:ABC transporter substrate-binding protein [bacterium]|nr:ABC transporter substrate-binding protein [bacterium]